MLKAINGNTGNSYITYSILKTLGIPTSLRKESHISNIWQDPLPDPGYINGNFNICLFTLQDQFQCELPSYIKQERLDEITSFLKKIKTPVVSYSLGTNFSMTQTLGKNIIPKKTNVIAKGFHGILKELSDKTESIGIRGHITEEALSSIGIKNTTIIGCPTYFENGQKQKIIKKEFSDSSPILGTGLFSTKELNPIYYIGQSEKITLKICHGSNYLPQDIYDIYANAYPGYANNFIKAIQSGRVKAFCNMDEWKEYIKSQKIELSVGTRVHGSIVAMNTGIPAICTAGDSRATEMCSYLGIPHMPGICGLDLHIAEFYNFFDEFAVSKKYTEGLKNYSSWLTKNKLSVLN